MTSLSFSLQIQPIILISKFDPIPLGTYPRLQHSSVSPKRTLFSSHTLLHNIYSESHDIKAITANEQDSTYLFYRTDVKTGRFKLMIFQVVRSYI